MNTLVNSIDNKDNTPLYNHIIADSNINKTAPRNNDNSSSCWDKEKQFAEVKHYGQQANHFEYSRDAIRPFGTNKNIDDQYGMLNLIV